MAVEEVLLAGPQVFPGAEHDRDASRWQVREGIVAEAPGAAGYPAVAPEAGDPEQNEGECDGPEGFLAHRGDYTIRSVPASAVLVPLT